MPYKDQYAVEISNDNTYCKNHEKLISWLPVDGYVTDANERKKDT